MRWLQLVGYLKLYVSFAEYSLLYTALLQKRPIILRSLLIVATPQPADPSEFLNNLLLLNKLCLLNSQHTQKSLLQWSHMVNQVGRGLFYAYVGLFYACVGLFYAYVGLCYAYAEHFCWHMWAIVTRRSAAVLFLLNSQHTQKSVLQWLHMVNQVGSWFLRISSGRWVLRDR